MNEDVLASLRLAVEANPQDAVLRLHMAGLLLDAGRHSEAISDINAVLQKDPAHQDALALLNRTVTAMTSRVAPAEEQPANPPAPFQEDRPADIADPGPVPEADPAASGTAEAAFDWTRAENEVNSDVPPPFVGEPQRVVGDHPDATALVEPAASPVTLKDVGGLQEVKRRLDESFLQPMKNAELAKAFGKSLRGGLLLYGPPGCGKTFLARAVAGELGAVFMSVTMTDILDPYIGGTERNLKAIFDSARASAPTVLFMDEVDAIGMKRSSTGQHAYIRQMVNELLVQMDSMAGNNDGLYLLAATNHPWDLDEALLRPGRLDRTLLVTPPDYEARMAILEYHLRDRPLAGIDLARIASRTDVYSGADLQHICTTAAEKAMTDSIQAGRICPITMKHIDLAMQEVSPSTLAWLESSTSVVKFSNEQGRYNDLAEFLRSRKML